MRLGGIRMGHMGECGHHVTNHDKGDNREINPDAYCRPARHRIRRTHSRQCPWRRLPQELAAGQVLPHGQEDGDSALPLVVSAARNAGHQLLLREQ